MCKLLCVVFSIGFILPVMSQLTVTEMNPMPEAVSNNAVTMANVNGVPHLFSFGGIDESKLQSGIHLRSYRYNTASNQWEQIPDLPDLNGKIAAAASTVKNKVYIIGGYHVAANGSETSSNKVHIYDPEMNTYLPDGEVTILPIDDHVQAVWRDSLIYVVTGWSNTTNVPNVQIYNPSLNQWSPGTSLPNSTIYKAFGASGMILGDTIYYLGGASTAMNFPAQSFLRKGIIDPLNPSAITWTQPITIQPQYRGVTTTDGSSGLYFLGGSGTTYNYNGIAYNGSGGVNPLEDYYFLDAQQPVNWFSDQITLPMDLRGNGEYSAGVKYLAGGMESNQLVSNKTLKIEINSILGNSEFKSDNIIAIYPNPFSDELFVYATNADPTEFHFHLFSVDGKDLFEGDLADLNKQLRALNQGNYILKIYSKGTTVIKQLTKR